MWCAHLFTTVESAEHSFAELWWGQGRGPRTLVLPRKETVDFLLATHQPK